MVRTSHRQSAHDRICFAKQCQRTRFKAVANDRAGRGGVEIVVLEGYPGTAITRVAMSDVSLAIPISVAQRKDPGREIALHVYEYVPVRGDNDVPCTPNAVGKQGRAKTFRQLQPGRAGLRPHAGRHEVLPTSEPRNQAKKKQRKRCLVHGSNGGVWALFSASLAPIAAAKRLHKTEGPAKRRPFCFESVEWSAAAGGCDSRSIARHIDRQRRCFLSCRLGTDRLAE